MARRAANVPPGLVTSDAVHRRFQVGRRGQLVVVAALVLIAVAGWCVYYYVSSKHHANEVAKQAAQQFATDSVHNSAKAVEDAQNALQKATTPQQKAAAYQDLGTAYLNNKQPSLAVTAYQNQIAADNSSQTIGLAALINAYIAAGQNQQAINTYQKLIQILKQTNNPELQHTQDRYGPMIQYLSQKGGA